MLAYTFHSHYYLTLASISDGINNHQGPIVRKPISLTLG
jgi:hypothetical protein